MSRDPLSPKKTDRILIMVKRVLLFSNQKNCSLTKAIIKERGKWDYPREKNLSEKEEERKKSTSILAKRNQE